MIVVLGASGRTGRVVAGALRGAGSRVRLVTRGSALRSEGTEVEVMQASLSNLDELAGAFDGARAVYALLPDDFRAERFQAERRAMAENLVRALERKAVGRVVLLSSRAAVLGEHAETGFAKELARLELRLFDAVPAVTVLRACYFQDNVAQAIAPARDGVYLNCLPSDRAIDMVAASDVARVAARALLQPSREGREIVDVTGPAYTPAEVAAVLGAFVGRPVSVVDTASAARAALFRQWMSEEAAEAMQQTLETLSALEIPLVGSRRERCATPLEQVLNATRGVAS